MDDPVYPVGEESATPVSDLSLDGPVDPGMLAETSVRPLTTALECEEDMQVRFTVRAFDDSHSGRQPSEGTALSCGGPLTGRKRSGRGRCPVVDGAPRRPVPTGVRPSTYDRT